MKATAGNKSQSKTRRAEKPETPATTSREEEIMKEPVKLINFCWVALLPMSIGGNIPQAGQNRRKRRPTLPVAPM